MLFRISSGWGTPCKKNTILLNTDNWDDLCFKTTFHAIYCDKKGINHELGTIKIGKTGMGDGGRISEYLDSEFESLPDGFFSLWQTAEAYKRVIDCEKKCHFKILKALKDIAYDPSVMTY